MVIWAGIYKWVMDHLILTLDALPSLSLVLVSLSLVFSLPLYSPDTKQRTLAPLLIADRRPCTPATAAGFLLFPPRLSFFIYAASRRKRRGGFPIPSGAGRLRAPPTSSLSRPAATVTTCPVATRGKEEGNGAAATRAATRRLRRGGFHGEAAAAVVRQGSDPLNGDEKKRRSLTIPAKKTMSRR